MTAQAEPAADPLTFSALTVRELKERARALRTELPKSAAEVDATNGDASFAMRRLWEEGFLRFNLPVEYGGITGADPTKYAEDHFDIILNLAAGDSAAAMNYVAHSLVTVEIFAPHNDLPEATKLALARLVHRDGIRFVASNSEAGSKSPVTAMKVDGGIVVRGTKTFNTNSGGDAWANVGIRLEGEEGRWHAIIPLTHDNVTRRGDWDVMGQRGTHSQTVDYNDVFVPDGYYCRGHVSPEMITYVFLTHAVIMLGPGFGALDAALDYVRELDRPSMPEFSSASEDPLIRRRIGGFAVELEAARTFLMSAARRYENPSTSWASEVEATVESFMVKVACVRAALSVTAGIFDLTGARSISNRYRFDRFWRNARTFSLHDPTDAKEVWVGDWYLSGKEPPRIAMLRV